MLVLKIFKASRMKYILLTIILQILLLANEIHYEHNFDKALQKAKSQNREVMMIYTAVWCPECNYMKDVVFKNREVYNYLEKYFIVLSLDVQKDKLPDGFEYMGIPTFFFIDKDAKEQAKIIGGAKADKFLEKLKALQ